MKHKGANTRQGDIGALLLVHLQLIQNYSNSSSGVSQSAMDNAGLTTDVVAEVVKGRYAYAQNRNVVLAGNVGIWTITAQIYSPNTYIWLQRGDGAKFELNFNANTSLWKVTYTAGSVNYL